MYDNGDILLYALSAWRDTPWARFKKSFDEVHRRHARAAQHEERQSATVHRWRAIRTLVSLGHVDVRVQDGAINLVVAPPVLAATPGFGARTAILCGARSPGIVASLRKAASWAGALTTTVPQSRVNPYAPCRIEVQASSGDVLQAVAERAEVYYPCHPPARSIAAISASLREYLNRLLWSAGEELNWKREDFDIDRLRFGPPIAATLDIRLSRYQDPVTSLWRYRLWHGDKSAEVAPDWGRYAALEAYSRQVIEYDAKEKTIHVPLGAPLPPLLTRALGLCSGYAPGVTTRSSETSRGLPWRSETFKNVPASVFKVIARKAGQLPS